MSLKKIENWVIFNSTATPSATNKWRIQPCKNSLEIGMLVWGEMQDGDYLQIHKSIYRGSSKCFGEPVLIPRKTSKSVLIGLRNLSGQSSFKIGAICFCKRTNIFCFAAHSLLSLLLASSAHHLLQSLFMCKEVIEYVMVRQT